MSTLASLGAADTVPGAISQSSGFGAVTVINTFTAVAATDLMTVASSHGLVNTDTVRFTTTGTLPAGLSTGTTYFVISSGLTATALKVSATLNGGSVDITGTGSGTHTISRYVNSVAQELHGLSEEDAFFNPQIIRFQFGLGVENVTWGTWDFPPGYVGLLYEEQWYIENVSTPCVFSLFSGSLPPGLTLTNIGGTAEGEVSGTPTTAGTYNFVLAGTNDGGTKNQAFSITISIPTGGVSTQKSYVTGA